MRQAQASLPPEPPIVQPDSDVPSEERTALGERSDVSGEPTTRGAPSRSASVMFIGHSLINHSMPWMFRSLALESGFSLHYKSHILNGTALRGHWNDKDKFIPANGWDPERSVNVDIGASAHVELPSGKYDVLVMTESVPLREFMRTAASAEYVGRFHRMATQARGTTRVYLYETWEPVGTTSDAWQIWRKRLDEARTDWLRLAQEGAGGGEPPIRLVPGGRALGAVYDALASGAGVGSLRHIKELFEDDIHLTAAGNYFIALVVHATIFGSNPIGLKAVRSGPFPPARDTFVIEDTATRHRLQEIAWQTVVSDPHSGVGSAGERRSDAPRPSPPK